MPSLYSNIIDEDRNPGDDLMEAIPLDYLEYVNNYYLDDDSVRLKLIGDFMVNKISSHLVDGLIRILNDNDCMNFNHPSDITAFDLLAIVNHHIGIHNAKKQYPKLFKQAHWAVVGSYELRWSHYGRYLCEAIKISTYQQADINLALDTIFLDSLIKSLEYRYDNNPKLSTINPATLCDLHTPRNS